MSPQAENRLERPLTDAEAEVVEPKEGAQSKVFDHGDFVLKVPVPPEEMLAKARRHPWFQEITIDEVKNQHAYGKG
jgi:hypothetical protein